MRQPTIEINSFTASDDFLKNPSMLHPVFDLVSRSTDGLSRLYDGIDVQDSKRIWIITFWDSYDHHKLLMESALYPRLVEKYSACIAGNSSSHHVIFNDNPVISLSSPVTEIARLRLKDLSASDDFITIMNELSNETRRATTAPIEPHLFGETREEQGLFYLIAGWESVEDFESTRTTFKPYFDRIAQLATLEIAHVTMREYGIRND